MPTTQWSARRDEFPHLAGEVGRALSGWNVSSAFLDMWLRSAADRVPEGHQATVVVEFDESVHLLSLDVWAEGRRVYGADDFML